MRCLCGPIGGAPREEVLAATELDVDSSDDDFTAWVAHRKVAKNMVRRDGAAGTKEKADKVKGGGDTLKRSAPTTGRRNQRCVRNSETHLSPECPQRGT